MIAQVADVAGVITSMQVSLHICPPHSPEFSRASDARKDVEFRVESP